MAIGERIHFFRTKRGMTQKYVGGQIGFDEKSADVRMAQYEKETRVPKDNLIKALANLFDVNPEALKVPDIDSHVGLMHTLFTLEDRYGLKIEKAEALESKQITQDEYDQWRYHYPVVGQTTHTHFAKVIPQEFSDMLIAEGPKINQSKSKKK